MAANIKKRPLVMIIRDGWGHNPNPNAGKSDAIATANTPVDDRLRGQYPTTLIKCSGEEVGLPAGVMGNSEVGHQNIGAGRIVDQEIMRITKTVRDGSFFDNHVLKQVYAHASETGGCVHIMGLCSDIGVHSILDHLYACVEAANKFGFPGDRVFIHAFGDGRDSPPTSGLGYIREVETKLQELGAGRVASVVGRFYAMDRDNRWERVETAYRMLVDGEGVRVATAEEAFTRYYENPTNSSQNGDEFIIPTVISPDGVNPLTTVKEGDSIIFFNFRGDRPRELTKAFTYNEFPFGAEAKDGTVKSMGFTRSKKLNLYYATMTAYEKGLPVNVIFNKPPKMKNLFGEYLANLGLKQFRCAETEKFPHVTFFFNDYRDDPFEGEDRFMAPSPREVATYDEKPEMSAHEVTEGILKALDSKQYDVLILNYANGDMVGHTGSIPAAIKAIETVDECVGKVVAKVQELGGALIITADHGNCEQMIDPNTGDPFTAHTTYDVPLIVVDDDCKGRRLREGGTLADMTPTALDILGLDKPAEMTGASLLL